MSIKLSQAWEDALAFLRREHVLVLPVALALFGLPDLLINLFGSAFGDMQPGTALPPALALLLLIAGATSMLGNLAISALVLRPGGSVGEALATSLRRAPGAIGSLLLVGLLLVVAAIPLGILLAMLGVTTLDPATPSPSASLLIVLVSVGLLLLAGRLAPMWAWMVAHERGGWAAIRGSFGVTRRVAWRLTLVLFLFLVTLMVVRWSVDAIARPLGFLSGATPVVGAVGAIVSALISAGAAAFWATFSACLYRRVEDARLSAPID